MPELLLLDVPDELYQRLKKRAARNHRSLTKEVLALLEATLAGETQQEVVLPIPFEGRFRISDAWIDVAEREGRA